MENKKQTLKARETIDKEYAEKLPLEDLVKVAGGVSSNTYKCPFCGMEFEKFGNILSEMEMKWHMAQHLAQHLLEENTPK